MTPGTSIHDPTRTRLVAASDVRDAAGWQDTNDISDSQVHAAIDDAMSQFLDDTARWLQGHPLDGDVDGNNTDFTLDGPYRLVADDTMDETIDASDVHVYTEDTSTTPPTRTTQTVSSVDSRFGVITLSSAPSSGVEVKMDGYVLKRAWNLQTVKRAVKALAAWYTYGTVRSGSQVLTGDPSRSEGDGDTDPPGIRHLRDYKRAIRSLQGGQVFSGASKDRRLPGRSRTRRGML